MILMLMNTIDSPNNDMTISANMYGHSFLISKNEKKILVRKEDVKKSAERMATSEYEA